MFEKNDIPVYDYIKSPDQIDSTPVHHPLIVVGAGPVGLAAGIDAGIQSIDTLVLDDNNTVSVGSRAVCYSKRFLEIMNRLGCAKPMVNKGVLWNVGKIFFQDELIRQFDLLPVPGYEQPAFINLQQYYLEAYMVERMSQLDCVEIRWKNKVVEVVENEDKVMLTVDTPDGSYQLSCDWLIVADGANSDIRTMMGLKSEGQVFKDRFLIVDIIMQADFPPERWFSFDPSYHRGWSTLLHRQADNVWRLDFQLGWDADPEEEMKPENIMPRVRSMLGNELNFELEWASVYTFTCRKMDQFRHGRLLYVGDAAHQVSPFGARGANSGAQDTDNLIWKLKWVIEGKAPECLLDSYSEERVFAAEENLMNSRRSTDFITPKSAVSKTFRNSTLVLARDFEFAQGLINSGRLSDTAVLHDAHCNTEDEDIFTTNLVPGAVIDDAPIKGSNGERWLLSVLGNRFTLLYFLTDNADASKEVLKQLQLLTQQSYLLDVIIIATVSDEKSKLRVIVDAEGLVAQRLNAQEETTYLIRPDQHITARWRSFNINKVQAALAQATCNTGGQI